jgi:hypothetical protein
VKSLIGLLIFLAFADDVGCAYKGHLPLLASFCDDFLVEPTVIKLRGIDIFMLIILAVASSKNDGKPGTVPAMKNVLLLSLATTICLYVYGVVRGGDSRAASWQTYLLLSSILVAFTVAAVFRTAQDYYGLAKWIMAAGVYRGIMCWVSYFTWGRKLLGGGGAYLTTHDDTILWVVGIMALIANAVDARKTTTTLRNLALMVFFAGAIQFNSRRLAWVSLAMGLAVMYFLFPPGAAKRRINRVMMAVVPLLALYVAVGWGRGGALFLPLKSLSTISTKEDASTLARNVENLGLIATANAWGSLLGAGWGHKYICLTTKYDISSAFELWQYVPHNSILGLLAFTGILGFAGWWLALPSAVFLNARVAYLAKDRASRTVALIGAAQIVVCLNQLYGDMGLFFFKPMYVLAISCGMALRLPRMAGVWEATAQERKARARVTASAAAAAGPGPAR